MKWKNPWLTKIVLSMLLASAIVGIVQYARSQTYYVTGYSFTVLFPTNSSLCFMYDQYYVNLTVITNNMTGPDGIVWYTNETGHFEYNQTTAVDILFDYNVISLGANNASVASNSTVNFVAGPIIIEWPWSFGPYWPQVVWFLPLMFILGMIGLGCMFIGPLYTIDRLKKKMYQEGFVTGLIITATGIAFFIAWLFGGG